MSSITEENKDIAIKFFEALSSGSETYLNYYNDDSIIWTAGDNSIGGTRTKQEIVDLFDHATVFNKNTPHVELAKELIDRGHHVLLVDYQPTSEMMVIDFAKKIKARLPKNIKLHSIKLQETDTSFAEWYASEN